jgi:hypothetical protein
MSVHRLNPIARTPRGVPTLKDATGRRSPLIGFRVVPQNPRWRLQPLDDPSG